MYRRSHGAASCGSGDSVAGIGVNRAVCHIGASNPISGAPSTSTGQSQLWKLQKCNRRNRAEVDSASFENCTLSIGRGDGTNGRRRAESGAGQPLTPRPRPPQAAPAQPRTGAPDAAGERGGSFGPGCEACAAPPPAARRSAPSPGDCSMVSAPTLSLSAVCRDSSDRGSRSRVCTIATRNKTSHSSAQGCGVL